MDPWKLCRFHYKNSQIMTGSKFLYTIYLILHIDPSIFISRKWNPWGVVADHVLQEVFCAKSSYFSPFLAMVWRQSWLKAKWALYENEVLRSTSSSPLFLYWSHNSMPYLHFLILCLSVFWSIFPLLTPLLLFLFSTLFLPEAFSV